MALVHWYWKGGLVTGSETVWDGLDAGNGNWVNAAGVQQAGFPDASGANGDIAHFCGTGGTQVATNCPASVGAPVTISGIVMDAAFATEQAEAGLYALFAAGSLMVGTAPAPGTGVYFGSGDIGNIFSSSYYSSVELHGTVGATLPSGTCTLLKLYGPTHSIELDGMTTEVQFADVTANCVLENSPGATITFNPAPAVAAQLAADQAVVLGDAAHIEKARSGWAGTILGQTGTLDVAADNTQTFMLRL